MKRKLFLTIFAIGLVALYMIYPRIGYYWHYWLVYDPLDPLFGVDLPVGINNNLVSLPVSIVASTNLNNQVVENQKKIIAKKREWPPCRQGKYCIIIPRIGVNMPIYTGTKDILEKGAWQQLGSRQVGQKNNFIITAHRFKWLPPHQNTFYNLDKLNKHDRIIIRRQDQVWVYVVNNSQEVNPDENWVLKDSLYEELTLYTCAPLWGDSRRLVIKAFLHENL